MIASPQQHPALAGQDFAPDLITADDTNQVTLWVECGKTTLHKLDKVTKRFREARLWMLMAHPHEAKRIGDAEGRPLIAAGEMPRFRIALGYPWDFLVFGDVGGSGPT